MSRLSCGAYGCTVSIQVDGIYLVVKMFFKESYFHRENNIIQIIIKEVYENPDVCISVKDAFERCTCIPRYGLTKLPDIDAIRDLKARVLRGAYPIHTDTMTVTDTESPYTVYTTFPITSDIDNVGDMVDYGYPGTDDSFIYASGIRSFREKPEFTKVYYDIIEAFATTLDVMQSFKLYHTDIKLDNIIIGFENGVYQGVKVIDFGQDFQEGSDEGDAYVRHRTYLTIGGLEKQLIQNIADKFGFEGKDPFQDFLQSTLEWGADVYKFNTAIQRAHCSVLQLLQKLTSHVHFKNDYLFQPHISNNPGFATFVELSQIVLLQWCIEPPERCGPSQFIQTARDALKRIVEPIPVPSMLTAISAAVYERCPAFLKRILKILAPIVVEKASASLRERDEWVNRFDPDGFLPTLRTYQVAGAGGYTPGYFEYLNGPDVLIRPDDPDVFFLRCLYEIGLAQFTDHESPLLKHVISAVSAPASTTTSSFPAESDANRTDSRPPWRGGKTYSLQSARTDCESHRKKSIVFSFAGVCVCILCSVLSSSKS